MVRVRGLIEIILMTLSAAGVDQLIISAGVAILALERRMFAGEGESRRRMIERRRRPGIHCMAFRACRRIASCHMIRVRCAIEIILMTLSAVRVDQSIVSAGVTILALERRMLAGERESRRRMIERRRRPRRSGMTRHALLRKLPSEVVRILYRIKIRCMACVAVLWSRFECVIRMAQDALGGTVRPRQRKGRLLVVEAASPRCGVNLMTLHAIRREARLGMIRILRVQIIGSMAPDACRRRPRVLLERALAVTRLAGNGDVLSDQREPCLLMALDHIGYLPILR